MPFDFSKVLQERSQARFLQLSLSVECRPPVRSFVYCNSPCICPFMTPLRAFSGTGCHVDLISGFCQVGPRNFSHIRKYKGRKTILK
eukprot:1155081-Pelagomonas_calceolata.AAC.1